MATGFSAVTYALCKKNTSAEVKKAIEGISGGMEFKGGVNTYEDLPQNPSAGDLYIIKEDGYKVVYDGSEWIAFDHELKALDKSITISNHKIGVKISTEVGNNLKLLEDGLFVPVEGAIGLNFTTDIDVGHLKAGTVIKSTDRISDILYKMLCTPTTEMIDFYYGASDDIPTSIEGLTEVEKNVGEILARRVVQNVETGDVERQEGQYPVFAIAKRQSGAPIKLAKLAVRGFEDISIPFLTIEGEDDFIYYIATKTYDIDMGGTDYILTFVEE